MWGSRGLDWLWEANTPEGVQGAGLTVRGLHPWGGPGGWIDCERPTTLRGSRGLDWLWEAYTPAGVQGAGLTVPTPLRGSRGLDWLWEDYTPKGVQGAGLTVRGQHPWGGPGGWIDCERPTPLWGSRRLDWLWEAYTLGAPGGWTAHIRPTPLRGSTGLDWLQKASTLVGSRGSSCWGPRDKASVSQRSTWTRYVPRVGLHNLSKLVEQLALAVLIHKHHDGQTGVRLLHQVVKRLVAQLIQVDGLVVWRAAQ